MVGKAHSLPNEYMTLFSPSFTHLSLFSPVSFLMMRCHGVLFSALRRNVQDPFHTTLALLARPFPLAHHAGHLNIPRHAFASASASLESACAHQPAKDPFDQTEPGDMILLRELTKNNTFLVGPLQPCESFQTNKGVIPHEKLIGLKPRSLVKSHLDHTFRVHFPSLDEYVIMMPRTAAPIYPKDAATVIRMLDLHPHHRILEAGTGSGALSLYLARYLNPEASGQLVSVELRAQHSQQAQRWVARYRRGQYLAGIDFRTGHLAQVLRGPEFRTAYPACSFHGAVLDLLEPWDYFEVLVPYLRADAAVVVYVPNITQAVQCMQYIEQHKCPLLLERCLEIIERPWTLKPVVVKWPEGRNMEGIDVNASCIAERSATDRVTHGSADPRLPPAPQSPEEKVDLANTRAFQTYNWVCRPSHMPTGHTAFLLKLKVTSCAF